MPDQPAVPPAVATARDDLAWMIGRLAGVLGDVGEGSVTGALPWHDPSAAPSRPTDASSPTAATDHATASRALALAFQLLNLVEENVASQARRAAQQRGGPRERGLWADVLDRLATLGIDEAELAPALSRLRVEPVLTAHPTEAKRATLLEHYRRLYVLLETRADPTLTPLERDALHRRVDAALERLWRTGDIFLEKPDVADELASVVYYLRRVFPTALDRIDERFRHEWAARGFDPSTFADPTALPRLSFSTWVGGDRDGHPLVTADVTSASLATLRANAIDLVRTQLVELARRLSLSDHLQAPPAALVNRIDELRAIVGDSGRAAVERNPAESWRQLVNLMLARLDPAEPPRRYPSAAELAADLGVLHDSLVAVGAHRLADEDVRPVRRSVETFGFHLATLDIRQNSAFHEQALAQLLTAARVGDAAVATWDEPARLAFLDAELSSPRPFVRAGAELGPEADAVLSCYRVLADELAAHGGDGVGSLIVSMTRSTSDLLTVYLFAREVGLLIDTPDGPVCPIPVVPLFETIDDLAAAPAILDAFLAHPITARGLERRRQAAGGGEAVQQVMVGYSDSNKDGGIIASLWGLYRGQAAMAAVGAARGVRIRFFHGRGGTISRGAGPTGRFLRAMPGTALRGDLRMTEQGETIGQKYANLSTAVFNLELLHAGLAEATLTHARGAAADHPLEPVLDSMADVSRDAYTSLLADDGFMTFYAHATPIDVIEQSRIGSRPARRTGRRSISDLRAIPWVFSWSQARFYLSGWYGVGTALEAVQADDPPAFARIEAEHRWWAPIHYILSNAATSVMTADPAIMRAYADLVEDPAVRDRVLGRILDEYDRTRRMLEILYGGPLEVQRPEVGAGLALRQPGLERLHRHQLELLRTWRATERDGSQSAADEMVPALLRTVNAIAAGLRTTG